MLPITQIGSIISHPGVVIMGSSDTSVNGIPNSRVTDLAICFIHGCVSIVSGSPHHTVNGLNCSRISSICSCGAIVCSGSPDSFTS